MVSKAVVPKAFGERLVNRSRNMVSKAVGPKAFDLVQSELVLPKKHFKFGCKGSRHCDARYYLVSACDCGDKKKLEYT